MIKKIISINLVLALLILVFCGCDKQTTEIYASDRKLLAELKDSKIEKNDYYAYVDIVLSEAADIIMSKENIGKNQSLDKIFADGYIIYTYCDVDMINAMKMACNKMDKKINYASAVTDLNGNLVAAYSLSDKSDDNLSLQKNPPYSTIKPIAIYAPALENKRINWSTVTEDSPYKKITDNNGASRDWPANATNTYSKKSVTVYEAIRQSLNTVAVKTLKDYGVIDSINFLKENFKLDLKTEEYKVNMFGEEESLGSVALGYTVEGVSTVDMAGYYQIFANGGNYIKPKAIKKIVDVEGKVIYERESESIRIISEETSYIMNELLKGVVTVGGTGEKANCSKTAVAGKTGTGDANSGNWFVGITPQYSCAVWHTASDSNYASEIFSNIIINSEITIKDFRTSPNVVKKIYCKESGKLMSPDCRQVELGYYTADNIPSVCDVHKVGK